MRPISDILIVSFDSNIKDKPSLCVGREYVNEITILKTELGEQANILYRLLTDQMAKAEIKAEKEVKE